MQAPEQLTDTPTRIGSTRSIAIVLRRHGWSICGWLEAIVEAINTVVGEELRWLRVVTLIEHIDRVAPPMSSRKAGLIETHATSDIRANRGRSWGCIAILEATRRHLLALNATMSGGALGRQRRCRNRRAHDLAMSIHGVIKIKSNLPDWRQADAEVTAAAAVVELRFGSG